MNYPDSENIRELMYKTTQKSKLFNDVIVICYCGKKLKAINYKRHVKSSFHCNCIYYPPYYNRLFFSYIQYE
jgi:hypothetical protein